MLIQDHLGPKHYPNAAGDCSRARADIRFNSILLLIIFPKKLHPALFGVNLFSREAARGAAS